MCLKVLITMIIILMMNFMLPAMGSASNSDSHDLIVQIVPIQEIGIANHAEFYSEPDVSTDLNTSLSGRNLCLFVSSNDDTFKKITGEYLSLNTDSVRDNHTAVDLLFFNQINTITISPDSPFELEICADQDKSAPLEIMCKVERESALVDDSIRDIIFTMTDI
jgi:hypothetical protein